MFNKKSTAEEVTKGLDLSQQTIVITGINSGIGYESLRVLTKRGAHVIGLARTLEKAKAACNSVEGKTTPLACELSDLDSVKSCAEQILAMNTSVDVLICNAGIMALPELKVKNGLELQFLTNHMGHFLLTYLLQEPLKAESGGRIVMLSSEGHQLTVKPGIDFQNLNGSQGYSPWKFYGQSKLANLLTAVAFNEKLQTFGVTANAVHPGVIHTNLARDLDGFLSFILSNSFFKTLIEKTAGKTIPQGASTQCYVATHPSLAGKGGLYFSDNKQAKTSPFGKDYKLAQQLWDYSVEFIQPYLGNESSEKVSN